MQDYVVQLAISNHGMHGFAISVSHLLVCGPPKDTVQASRDGYAALASRPRDVLQMLKQKPKSIQFYEPKFDDK